MSACQENFDALAAALRRDAVAYSSLPESRELLTQVVQLKNAIHGHCIAAEKWAKSHHTGVDMKEI